MHRRVEVFPPIEADDANVFASPASDLLLRTLEPAMFEAQLRMEAPTAPFKYTRRFLVLDASGNYRVKTVLGVCDDPAHVPSHAKTSKTRAMVKLLDLIELVPLIAPQVRPRRFVRARWSSGPNTWLDVETLPFSSKALAQELYVATAHSWHLVDAIKLASWDLFKTETALWEANPAVIQYRAALAQLVEQESPRQGERVPCQQEAAAVSAGRSSWADVSSTSSDESSTCRKRRRLEQAASRRTLESICVKRRQPSAPPMPQGINLASLVPGASSDIVIISLDSDSEPDVAPPPDEQTTQMQRPPLVVDLLDSPAVVHSTLEPPSTTSATTNSSQDVGLDDRLAGELGAAMDKEADDAPPSPNAPSSVSWSPGCSAPSSDDENGTDALTPVQKRHRRKPMSPPEDPPHVSPDDDLLVVKTTRKHHNVILDDDDDDETASVAPPVPTAAVPGMSQPVVADVAPVPSNACPPPKDAAPGSLATMTLAPDVVPDAASPTAIPCIAPTPPSVSSLPANSDDAPTTTTQRKMAFFQPLPRPAPRWACPCGNSNPIRPYASSFLVCRAPSCGAWMHRMCVPPTTVYCAQCVPLPVGVSAQVFQSAVWQASATNNVVWLETLLATRSYSIDWTYVQHGDTCVLIAAKTDSMQALLRLLTLLPAETWPTFVSHFERNVLNLTCGTKQLGVVTSIIARCPPLLCRLDILGQSAMALYMAESPRFVVALLQRFAPLRTIYDDLRNTWAHYLCVSLPDNFATLLALLPPVQMNLFNLAATPLMLLCQHVNVSAAHIDFVVRLQPNWLATDSQGNTAVHWLITAHKAPLLRHLPTSVVHATPSLYATAILRKDEAAVGVLQELHVPLCTPQAGSGLWPIAMATTASMVRTLLAMDPLPQLEYVCNVSQQQNAEPPVVLRLLLDDMALGEFLNSLVAGDLQAAKGGFFQRYRSVLCVDLKLVQLQEAVRNASPIKPSNAVVHVVARDRWWASFANQVKTISDWRQPIDFLFHDDKTVRSTKEAATCNDLWLELQAGFATGDVDSLNLVALGLLLGHMVVMRQTISSPRLPLPLLQQFLFGRAATGPSPSPRGGFVYWSPVATSDAAATLFRKGFRYVVGDLLVGWHALEVSVLLHTMTAFPVPLETWQASVSTASAPMVVSWWWQFLRSLRPIELYMVYSCVGGDKPVNIVLLEPSAAVLLRDGTIGLPTVATYAELALRARQGLRNPLI
ncbi:hypothetical protein SDRG_14085 [Saprolegnia diclina VS20]|uniref:Zinc finger PHD-type domain-containing protein n=1 Tax=Saprolegnia diclina (strain VS20) TaxID=1156394 RepID=T0Q3X5_SAPDV|nr:hypothetical protein SDRG_14085 [Saprolegnia diclina VS20]EQC28125.1 hypothetical protein SDRG_14085 [Saprolegnia diclina VS20]|eukprot:XP_008618411.1 hypothetical protein SDRG_14085 [Saprolegnia diclina VS20]